MVEEMVLEEDEKAEFVSWLDYWEPTKGGSGSSTRAGRLAKDQGKAVLEILPGGWNHTWLKGREFENFVLEVRLRKGKLKPGYAGVNLRGLYKVFFRLRGVLVLTERERCIHQALGYFPADKYMTLKVVCAGPVLRVYVNEQIYFEKIDAKVQPGRIGLLAHGERAFFDDVRIVKKVPPEQFVGVEPRAEDNALVYPPDKPVKLTFELLNASDTEHQAEVAVCVKDWDEVALTESIRGSAKLPPNSKHTLQLDIGKLSPGYYKIALNTVCDGRSIGKRELPLAIQERGQRKYEHPLIVVAPYWYFGISAPNSIVCRTYLHAGAYNLISHNINGIVGHIGQTREEVRLLRHYGITVITRAGKFLDEPNVIGTLIRDEPKPDQIPELVEEYKKLRQKTDKIITSCMVGDGGLSGWVEDAWKQLAPLGGVRFFRWYAIKKHYYGIRRRVAYKNYPSFIQVLREARSTGKEPYWVLIPTFGGDQLNAYFCNPMPSEVKAMMHLSLAFGAKGLLFYTYQPSFGSALVETTSLKPLDGKYEAIAQVAGYIKRFGPLLSSLKFYGKDRRCDNYAVELIPLHDGKQKGVYYIYAINTDKIENVQCRIFNFNPNTEVTDLYADKKLEVKSEEVELPPDLKYETGVIHLKLGPGEGKLLKFHEPGSGP